MRFHHLHCFQNANRRPTTFKLLLLPSIRQKAEEVGVPMMDQQTLIETAEKLAPKVRNLWRS